MRTSVADGKDASVFESRVNWVAIKYEMHGHGTVCDDVSDAGRGPVIYVCRLVYTLIGRFSNMPYFSGFRVVCGFLFDKLFENYL